MPGWPARGIFFDLPMGTFRANLTFQGKRPAGAIRQTAFASEAVLAAYPLVFGSTILTMPRLNPSTAVSKRHG
jgi:hypothetical protein